MQKPAQSAKRAWLVAGALSLATVAWAEDAPEAVFIKADPEVDAVMDYSPRTLRVYLTRTPVVERSSLKLTGPDGEIALTRFHTMGADDLMIEVGVYPLPNGTYTVDWTATFGDDEQKYAGDYEFTVAIPED